MKIKVTKDLCEIKENEIWNVGDYNVHTVQVELSPEFNGLVNKVRYFVEDKSYDMLITDNVAQVPYEATLTEGTIKIGVYGYDADTNILVQSTSPVNKYISSGTYTGEADNTEPLTPTDKEQMETAIQKNTNDITDLKANKQDKLISGVNIKTINNESILSGGNLTLVTEETDPIFTNSPAYSITDNDITYWNNKANMSDIPDVSNFITKDVDDLTYYTKSTDMQNAIDSAVNIEKTARENADVNLQNQIDAITVSSDVVDVVSTYQDLVDYDTQHIKANDIIKVMQDSTHDNAISYYRWVIVNHVGSWEYVGSEGPYYTKSETDTFLNAKQNTLISGQNIKTINSESLLGEGNITIQGGGSSDYEDLTNKPKINNVELNGNKSLSDLGIQPAGNYALESDMTEAQNDIENLSKVSNLFEKITATGTNITLNDTSDTIMKLNLDTTTSSQEDTPSPSNPQTIHTINGDNTITISNSDNTQEQSLPLNLPVDNIFDKDNSPRIYAYFTGNNLWRYYNDSYSVRVACKPNTSYVISANNPNETIFRAGYIDSDIIPAGETTVAINSAVKCTNTNTPIYITTGANAKYIVIQIAEDSANDTLNTLQVEPGIKANSYTPYGTTPLEYCKIGSYADEFIYNTTDTSLELNKWYLKKNVGKVVLDGEDTGIKVISSWDTTSLSGSYQASFSYLLTKATSTEYVILSNYFEKALLSDRNTKTNIIYTYSDGVLRIATNTSTTKADFLTWLSTHNTEVYYVLTTPTYILLNDTLQTQLNNIQYALAYDTQTNISQTNNDLPFIINAETYAKIGGGGTSDYTNLTNKPKINNVELNGNKSLNDLGIQPVGNYALESDMTEAQNDIEALQTENERLKATLPTTTGEGQDITLDKTAEMEFVKPPLPRGNTKQDTTTGKNLLPPLDSGSLNGLTFTTNSNGITTISGTTTNVTNYFKNVSKILPAGTYTLSINLSYTPPASSSQLILQDINNVRLATINLWKITSKTFTLSADTEIKNYYLFSNSGIQHNGTISIQLEEGSTATSYEPYTNGPSPNPSYPQEIRNVTGNVEVTISNENNTESKTLPVSLGNIELCKIGDYQDYLYKNNGKWYKHKVINKYICTGGENWAYSSYWSKTNTNVFYANVQNDINFPDWDSNTSICNYFITYSRNGMFSLDDNGFCFSGTVGITGASFTVRINKAIATDLAAFKSWLSTHNTIVYYVLATPTSTEITDVTLISQLEEISKTLSYQGQTNITSNTIALFDVEAYQSTKLILENLDSRLTLVEG